MYTTPIFFTPIFMERIWGGQNLGNELGIGISSEKIGEAWTISAHKKGHTVLRNGILKGERLVDIWKNYPHLFGKESYVEEFPLLVKIIAAQEDLSVQVHPTDNYAQEKEGVSYGKSECWYVLKAETNSQIIFGHHAKSKKEFLEKVKNEDWDELFIKKNVQQGDFIYIPSGTIHSIGKGITLLEIQQSSDITYRVYDYGRKDTNGNKRKLNIDSALNNLTFPNKIKSISPSIKIIDALKSTRYIKESYFTVYHWKINGKVSTPLVRPYLIICIIEGKGKIITDGYENELKKGDHFIIPSTIQDYQISGNIEMIVTHET